MKKKGFTLIELLGVIVILGVIITLAVVGYNKYLVSGRNKSYSIAEKSFKSAAVNSMMDCMTNQNKEISLEEKRNFCDNHPFPEGKYENTYVYLNDLVNLDYIEPIHDPKNTEELCSYSSYVYLSNKADTSVNNNMDLEYTVCLMCGDYKSESCLPEVEETNSFLASCSIYTDEDKSNEYVDGWDDNLYLYMYVNDDAGFYQGIDYFNVKIGSNSRIVDAKDNKALLDLSNFIDSDKKIIDSQDVKIVAVDGANRGSKEITCGTISIDKSTVSNARIIATKENTKAEMNSGSWSNENLLLTAVTNPKNVSSGFRYKWYKNGEVVKDWSSDNTYLIGETGKYYFEVKSIAEDKVVKSEEYDAKIDTIKPTCKVLVDESTTTKYGNYYIKGINLEMTNLYDEGGSGVESNILDVSKITTSVDNKVVTGTIKDVAGNVNTCTLTVNVDVTTPSISAKSNPLSLGNQDYAFTSNLNIAYGSTGGTVICNPENSQKTGTYDVTCTATGNNGLSKSVTFGARHSYAAFYNQKTCNQSYSCKKRCEYLGSNCVQESHPSYSGGCRVCDYSCGRNAYACWDSGNVVSGWGGGYDYNSTCYRNVDCSYYSCPDGGTLSGTTCVY